MRFSKISVITPDEDFINTICHQQKFAITYFIAHSLVIGARLRRAPDSRFEQRNRLLV